MTDSDAILGAVDWIHRNSLKLFTRSEFGAAAVKRDNAARVKEVSSLLSTLVERGLISGPYFLKTSTKVNAPPSSIYLVNQSAFPIGGDSSLSLSAFECCVDAASELIAASRCADDAYDRALRRFRASLDSYADQRARGTA